MSIFITLLKSYWQYVVIALLVAFIGFQKIELANAKVNEIQLQSTIDIMTPIITSNNDIIDKLNKDSKELDARITNAVAVNDQLRLQMNKRVTDVVSIKLPANDCSKSLKIMTAEVQKELTAWNEGK